MKLRLLFILTLLTAFAAVPSRPVAAHETAASTDPNVVSIEVFERQECVHCQAEKTFLTELGRRRTDFTVSFHDIGNAEDNSLWQQLTNLEGMSKVTPITLVGSVIIQGFDSAETTGTRIEALIDEHKGKKNYTFEEFVMAGGSGKVESFTSGTCADGTACPIDVPADQPWLVTVPFLGPIDAKGFSLPTLSVVLGFIDGFNPCAMWVLVTFLIVLAQVGSRRKMWEVAGLFIIAEAVMYYLILNVWFTAWDFVGLDNVVTPLVGLVAIGGGIFFLYEWKKTKGTCKVINLEQRGKISQRIKALVSSPLTLLTAAGIVVLAFSVNVIEFACSIGIPQAFTKIIELNQVGFWQTQFYMALYILFYMVDDFIVFAIALYSFEKIGVTSKYSSWSSLIGGILMIALGLILIFKRQWLIFG